uniref:Uncharacterized protein n=1 Tax=Moumouvirus sp. 'Monve' TaxID=1128131 RepID=H2EEA0_9VIRU|nr:hypothetical protein mv_L518 [Moumouvirus Monve]
MLINLFNINQLTNYD